MVGQLGARFGELSNREDESAEQPVIRRTHIGRLVLQRLIHGKIRRRKKPGVIDRVGEERVKRSSRHGKELNGAIAAHVNRLFCSGSVDDGPPRRPARSEFSRKRLGAGA